MINSKIQKNGFTLIELLVVVAIIGLLSSVVLASLSGARERARVTKIVGDFKQIETGMTLWMQQTDRVEWPNHPFTDQYGQLPVVDLRNDSDLGEYLGAVTDPPFGQYYYRSFYLDYRREFTCGDKEEQGINIFADDAPENIAEQVNEIIDDDDRLDCGKVRWHSDHGGRLIYMLSDDGNL